MRQGQILFAKLSFFQNDMQRVLHEDEGEAGQEYLALRASASAAELGICFHSAAAADAEFLLRLERLPVERC